MSRRLLRRAGFVSGIVVGALGYRRLVGGRREQVEIYFDDGSFVTFASGSPEAARLLPLARQVLVAARKA